jgi:drug/metabolite transporter (DMT)-like permease
LFAIAKRRMRLPTSSWITPAAGITAVALWGLAFPLIQEGLKDFSPILLGFVRFAIASALMLVVIAFRHKLPDIMSTIKREWKPLLILGVLYVAIPNVAQNMGLQNGTSSIASVIQSSGPVMTLLFAVLLLKERMTRFKGMGTAIAMSGTVLLVFSGEISLSNDTFVSSILILISAASYGLAWVSAKRMLERNPPMLIIGLSLAFGTLVLGLALPFDTDPKSIITAMSILNLLVLGLFCAGLSSVLYLTSLERHEVSQMAFFIYLMPVFASIFAWAILGQGVATWTAVCGIIIVAGIVIANKSGRTRSV